MTERTDNHVRISQIEHEAAHAPNPWFDFFDDIRRLAETARQRRAAREAQNETAPGNDGRSSETTTTEATDQACPPGNGDK